MRTQKQLVFYQSILEVLQESGCPFCRFLKEYQAARLREPLANLRRSQSHKRTLRSAYFAICMRQCSSLS